MGRISRLPYSIRVVLESALRNFDGKNITEDHIRKLAAWKPKAVRNDEVPFVVARVLLQDMTGVPLVVDFAALRDAVKDRGGDPAIIEPRCPAHLVIDHSVQVDKYGSPDALAYNTKLEIERNTERYRLIKWSAGAFKTFKIVPPGNGICHQINLERLSRVAWNEGDLYYPDSLVGTDSHTTMANGLGVLGWGVGGIEAEAAMLGRPLYFLEPDCIGVHLTGSLREGTTATDLVLRITEILRRKKVVGKFVEFFGEGAASLSLPDRATISNMAPEYGATCSYFPVDGATCEYLKTTGRGEFVPAVEAYYRAQGMFGMPAVGDIDYTEVVEIDLGEVRPSIAGPGRPQDRLDLGALKSTYRAFMAKGAKEGGYGKPDELGRRVPTGKAGIDLGHGDILIAAISSCTNTSNPGVMLAAGLLAKKAVERGLKTHPRVKTSLAPGSLAVTEYLRNAGLLPYLEQLGFDVCGYGCTTCIGNSGPLDPQIEAEVTANDLITASVLSGNRNFEARIHQSIKANFLMSPPLVVAFALAGTIDIDLETEPLGTGTDGKPVYLADLWPSSAELGPYLKFASDPAVYGTSPLSLGETSPAWDAIQAPSGVTFEWDEASSYIRKPPYFDGAGPVPQAVRDVRGARVLAVFGDSITTDHISPAGGIKASSPAGIYLQERGIKPVDFNTYGARRGNHELMMRGTFANVRIKNAMAGGKEGGLTVHHPSKETMSIYDAAMRYREEGVPVVVFGGDEYGQGSSRDWAAKGPQLLGARAVIVRDFERIHRSNLICMGVLPLQFLDSATTQSLGIDGSEIIDLTGLEKKMEPKMTVTMTLRRANGQTDEVPLRLRIDTPVEVEYFTHGGILPYVLRELLAK